MNCIPYYNFTKIIRLSLIQSAPYKRGKPPHLDKEPVKISLTFLDTSLEKDKAKSDVKISALSCYYWEPRSKGKTLCTIPDGA